MNEETLLLRIKDMDADDQPRERALKYGINSLSTPDLWALILRTGIKGTPITELCRRMMRDNNNSLYRLERRVIEEIMMTKGIGTTKALQIAAVMEIVRRYNKEKTEGKYVVKSAASIYEYVKADLANLPHEEIWVILMNRRNEVVAKRRSTKGSAIASIFDIKSIMKEAILNDAQTLALCHNHPSGALMPSGEDDVITRKMKEGAALLDIRMLDHLIVTPAGYYSYMEHGRL